MQLLSFKNFYLGWDESSFFDVSVHLGKIRVECGGFIPPRHKRPSIHEPTEEGHHE